METTNLGSQAFMLFLIFGGGFLVFPIFQKIMTKPVSSTQEKNKRGGSGFIVIVTLAAVIFYSWVKTGGYERSTTNDPASQFLGIIVGGVVGAFFMLKMYASYKMDSQ